jgi:Uma2 family endonuclease
MVKSPWIGLNEMGSAYLRSISALTGYKKLPRMMSMMDFTTLVSPEELIQRWAELGRDEQSPDYYELTEYGELVLSPRAETNHQRICSSLVRQLSQQLGGEAVQEVAVLTTTAGLRVPDVVWMPQDRWNQLPVHAVVQAPELVVEVLSPGNRKPEMNHKIQGYLQSGVKEVVVIGLTGTIDYIREDGVHPTSVFNLTLSLPSQLFS